MLSIRPANAADVPLLNTLIHEFAEFEHLPITAAYIKEIGAEGLISPFTLSCRDHEGGGGVKFQQ